MKQCRDRGFLVLEILIAGLILTASIAATMYLFSLGYRYLDQTRQSNMLSSKLVQVAALLKTMELDKQSGTEDMGDGVTLTWQSRLLGVSLPTRENEFGYKSPHELRIYQVDFATQYRGMTRAYQINVFRYKPSA